MGPGSTGIKPRTRIFFLPFAGASYYSYSGFKSHLERHFDVVLVDLPGRGRRVLEPLLTDCHEMVEDLFDQITEDLSAPYAIFGHSLGATLGYLLTSKLAKLNIRMPLHLFVSGRPEPSYENKKKYLLPKAEFIKKVTECGGIPDEILREKELLDFFEPIIRADFQAIETCTHEETETLNIPITVLLGTDDKSTKNKTIRWHDLTTRDVAVKHFVGDHFFLFQHLPEISHIICQKVLV